MKRALRWLLALALTINMVGVAQAQPESPRAHPALLQMAKERPSEKVKVIVQRKAHEQLPPQALERAGGKVTKELPIINGFVMELPARAVEALAKSKGVRWISIDAPTFPTQFGSETVRDEFTTVAFDNNNGTTSWQGPWVENDPGFGGTGPTTGNVRIYGNELRLDDFPYTGRRPSAARAVDLSNGATTATLTFDFHTGAGVDPSDEVVIEVSRDGGTNYTILEAFTNISGITAGSRHFDISSYISADTTVRFRVTNLYAGFGEYFYVDNVQIEHNGSGTGAALPNEPAPTPPPLPAPTVETATLITENSLWRYLDNGSDQGTAWQSGNFDDSHWSVGATQLGYGDGDETTVVSYGPSYNNKYVTTYFRHPFYLSNAAGFTALTLRMIRDDGIVVYLNGTEVYRNNMPGGPIAYNTYASSAIMDADENAYLTAAIDPALLVNGENILAVEIHQANSFSYDISFNLALTGDATCVDCVSAENLAGTFASVVGSTQLWNERPPRNGDDVVVAVVDSGINDHKDFRENDASRIIAAVNFSTDPDESDRNGHGTHIAGIIAGNGAASHGQRIGIAPKAKLVNVKVTNEDGMGYISDIVAGLQWVYENKDIYNIRVVNISVNSAVAESYHVSPLSAAVELLWFNGIVVVTAVGNNGLDTNPITLYPPANDPFVITVGATNDGLTRDKSDDFVEPFSAYGTTEDGFTKPELVAPGRNIISLLASEQAKLFDEHPAHQVDAEHFRMSGTSMSTPIASGVAALLLQDEPELTPDQVKYRLMATADSSWPGYDATKAGAGYVDATAAIHGTTTENANTGIPASNMLFTGDDPVAWDTVSWSTVSWSTVSWSTVSWSTVSWSSVCWDEEVMTNASVLENTKQTETANNAEALSQEETLSEPSNSIFSKSIFLPIIHR